MADFRAALVGAAGAFGMYAAQALVEMADCSSVLAIGRSSSRLGWLRDQLGPKIETCAADVRDTTTLIDALSGCDVLLNAAGPSFELAGPTVDAALGAAIPYADLCDDAAGYETLLAREQAALAAGLTIVAGCGCSGGITNIAAAELADSMESVEQIDVLHGAPPGQSLGGEANLRHLLDLIDATSPALVDRVIVQEPNFARRRLYDFGPGVDVIECATISHPEPLMFRRELPGVRESRVWLGLQPAEQMELLETLSRTGLASATEVVVSGVPVVIRDVIAAFLYQIGSEAANLSRDGPTFAVHVEGVGLMDGVRTRRTLSTVQGAGRMTGVPLAVGGRWLALRRIDQPGVHTAGLAVRAREDFANELRAFGSDLLRLARQEVIVA